MRKNAKMTRSILLAAALFMAITPAAVIADTGPSSSQSPYLIPVAPGVDFTSILTAGDEVNTNEGKKKHEKDEVYRMVGIPDGLGAYDNGDGTIIVLMNHEINTSPTIGGIPRAHGGAGSFVSKWKIRKRDLKVLDGEDLIQDVRLWDPINQKYIDGPGTVFSRFCSADLPLRSAFFNVKTGKGFSEGRIFMNGEEDSGAAFGRAMAHIIGGRQDGTSYELPKMGRHAWENLLASPYPQDKTIVVGNEDGGLNKVFIYVGEKQRRGTPIEMAGLTNGSEYELNNVGYTNDDPVTGFKSGAFTLVTSGGTSLARPEDGAWDTINPNRFYFVTTASITGNSRLWRMTFKDIKHPEMGGTIEVLVEGNAVPSPQVKMMDNITVDGKGNVYMQEDVGGNVRIGQVWMYNPKTNTVTNLAQHDLNRFLSGGTDFLTQDEESSGIIEVTRLFEGVRGYDTGRNRYFLLDVQAHYPIDSANPHGFTNPDELYEGGQLLMMKVPREGFADDDRYGDDYDDLQ
jgi:hypothetical protein